MRVRLYLDTSVVSARVDDRLPERKRATVDFWTGWRNMKSLSRS
jgi:hypothetical protein